MTTRHKKQAKNMDRWEEYGFIIRRRGTGFQVDLGTFNAKRKRKNFKTLTGAKDYCKTEHIKLTNKGTDAFNLSDRDRLDATDARANLGTVSIAEAVDFYLRHHKPEGGPRTVKELIKEYLENLGTLNRRPDTVDGAKWRLNAFEKKYGKHNVHEVTREDIESWLDQKQWRGLNRLHYLAVVHAFFQYAKKRKLISLNPAEDIDKPEIDRKAPEIMSPKSIRKVLNMALQKEPALVTRLAISFFSGLRPNETKELDWKDIDFSEKIIRVIPAVAKMRRQRLVDMSDNLVAWLHPFRKDAGKVWPYGSTTYSHKKKKVFDAAKIKLPYNAGRHAFASYHYAQHRDANETSLQLGHTNPNLLVTTYRGLVTRKAATDFWAIRPKQTGR